MPSEPVPGAEITVEQHPGPVTVVNSTFTTNQNGEFTLILTSEQLARLPGEFTLRFTIKPKDPGKYPADTNRVVLRVKKSEGPRFVFVVTYNASVKTNKGTFAVNSKAQT